MKKPLSEKQILKILSDNLEQYKNLDYNGFRDWLYLIRERGVPKYWDSLTYYRVYRIYKNLQNNYDEVTVITGYEGSGKSVLASQIATVVTPSFTKDRIAYDPSDLPRAFKNLEKGETVWLDEGALFLFSRNAVKKENKLIIQLLSIVRQMNLHLIICVPNFFVVDTYLRDHRVKNLIHIHKNRKAFLWFKREAISYLNYHGKTVKNISLGFKHIPKHWAFIGNWNGFFGETDSFTEQDYINAKTENMNKFMLDIQDQLSSDSDDKDIDYSNITAGTVSDSSIDDYSKFTVSVVPKKSKDYY